MSAAISLFYREKGAGAPLFLLHGLFGSGDNLGGLFRAFSADYRVIAVDLRNHGRSPHVSDMSYPLMALDILALMDQLNIEKALFFGHSMGGKVAMQLALQAPERVAGLMIGDIAPVTYEAHHAGILEGMRFLAQQAPQARIEAEALLSPFIKEPQVLSFLMTNWRRLEKAQTGQNQQNDINPIWGWRLNLTSIIKHYLDIMAAPQGTGLPYAGASLFIKGALSDYILPAYEPVIKALFPKAKLSSIDGTGHWFHAEKPDATEKLLRDFLTAL